MIAQHLWEAAPVGVAKRAAVASERAAEVALRRVSYHAAEELLTKAVQLRKTTGTSLVDDEAELLAMLRLLEVARALRYYQGVNAINVQRAKDLAVRCGRRDLLLELAWFEWSTLSTSVRRHDSESFGRAYVALTVEDPDPAVRASGHQVQGVVDWQAGRIVDACASLDRAIALLDDATPASPFLGRQVMLTNLFWIMNHALHGDLSIEDAFARFDALISDSTDRLRVASICGFAAITSLTVGRWSESERYANLAAATDPESQFGF